LLHGSASLVATNQSDRADQYRFPLMNGEERSGRSLMLNCARFSKQPRCRAYISTDRCCGLVIMRYAINGGLHRKDFTRASLSSTYAFLHIFD
jgi:hypothetical protein